MPDAVTSPLGKLCSSNVVDPMYTVSTYSFVLGLTSKVPRTMSAVSFALAIFKTPPAIAYILLPLRLACAISAPVNVTSPCNVEMAPEADVSTSVATKVSSAASPSIK